MIRLLKYNYFFNFFDTDVLDTPIPIDIFK